MAEVLNTTQINTGLAGFTGETAPAFAEKGELAGYEVRVSSDPLDLLADAAEELTFGQDNTKELDLKERKAKSDRQSSMVDKIDRYQELMARSGQKSSLERLMGAMKNARDAQKAWDQALEEFGGDPTLAWAALKQIKADLEGQAPPEVLATLEQAALELESRHGGAIRAGLAGTLAAQEHEGLGQIWELGADYRQTVRDFYDRPDDMFAFIQDKYGPDRFEEALDFLFKSLGDDLASDQPSFGSAHLEAVGAGLGQARVLNGAHAIFGRLLERWDTVHQVPDCELKPLDLVREFLKIKNQRFLSPDDLAPLATAARAPDIEREVLFLQELLGTVRLLSPQFFEGTENRLKVLETVQEALDRTIAREDEYLASLQE
jgi:type III secretion protein W